MIELFRKPWVALLFFCGALYAQIPHAAYVFACSPYIGRVCPVGADRDQLPWVYALAVEGAVLLFVVHGRRASSYGFACASFAVNLAYYAMSGVTLFSVPALPAWLISLLIPCAIVGYSHIATDVGSDAHDMQRAVAWVRGLVHPVNRSVEQPRSAQPSAPIVQEGSAEDVHDASDGAPDVQDKKAYARWLHMEKGVGRAELAAKYGVDPSTITRWLNGASKVQA